SPVAAQSVHVFLSDRRVGGRPHLERGRSGRLATNAATGEIAAAQGRLRNVVACAGLETKHRAKRESDRASIKKQSTTEDAIDAGGRKGCCGVRPVQKRSGFQMRSGCDCPCMAGAEHAARNHAK